MSVEVTCPGTVQTGGGTVTVTVPLLATADHPLGSGFGVDLSWGVNSPGVPSVYVNDVLQPARAWAPVHAAFDCVNAMCGKTWNLAVVCAVAPIPSTTTTLNSQDRKSTRLNSSHRTISYAVFCLKKKK